MHLHLLLGVDVPCIRFFCFLECRWGQVPLVEFEGKSLTQSLAVTRYFAKRTGLVPEDPYEAALCDEYVDAVRELMTRKRRTFSKRSRNLNP